MSDLCVFNPLFKSVSSSNEVELKSLTKSYFKQLWQLDNIVILLGAGLSKFIGGPLMTDLSSNILPQIILSGFKSFNDDTDMNTMWENLWAVPRSEITNDSFSQIAIEIIKDINIEEKLSQLKMLSFSLDKLGKDNKVVNEAIETIKNSIISTISKLVPNLIDDSAQYELFSENVKPVRELIKRLVKLRRPNQPRVKIFTTNYDLIVETACDIEGISCNTGFEGKHTKSFNPSNFDISVSLKPSGQNTVYYPNSIYLYKLHGSVDWTQVILSGIPEIVQDDSMNNSKVIYPAATKYNETLEMPFGEMFRRFGECVSQPQTVIVTIGYGFMDEHVNQVLFRSLKNPSTQLVVIEPSINYGNWKEAKSSYIAKFINETGYTDKEEKRYENGEPRLCVIGGNDALFPKVLDFILPQEEYDDPMDKIKGLIKELTSLGDE